MSPYRSVNVSKLTPGDTLVESVFTESRTKLLGTGCKLSEDFINGLAERGVTQVLVEKSVERNQKNSRRVAPVASLKSATIFESTRVVEHSCQCGSRIAIRPPVADLPVATWICRTCGAAYFGGIKSAKNRGVAILAVGDGNPLVGGDQTELASQSAPVGSELATSTAEDRRREKRHSIGVPVVAVPLQANFRIAGPAVQMMTRDISRSGIALAHTRFSEVPYYVIDFTAAGMKLLQVVFKVLRVSHSGPIYEVAGKFIDRLHCANWHNKCL